MTTARVYLSLGRVSNLPTVWSNVLAGAALAGAGFDAVAWLTVLLSMTLYYTAGMYLNDAFDREIDARERPERPIPAGLVSYERVLAGGVGQLMVATALLAVMGASGRGNLRGVVGGVALAAAIVVYDLWHKGNPLSPVLMGLCRALVYVGTALTLTGQASARVWIGALVLFAYLNVLTYVAKQKGVPGRTVARFIAGISVVDALLIASAGAPLLALIAALGFPLTLAGQRYVSGT